MGLKTRDEHFVTWYHRMKDSCVELTFDNISLQLSGLRDYHT